MPENSALIAAAKAKKDQFYTQRKDIEYEMRFYRPYLRGKTIFCNCDDPFESEFFQFFALNFKKLGLKKLITTSYVSSPIAGTLFRYAIDKKGQTSFLFGDEVPNDTASNEVGGVFYDPLKHAYKAVVTAVHDATGNGAVEMVDVAELFKMGENKLTQLEGNGAFDSPECLALLDEADIVVTNPPFSLFREYMATLIEHDKKFIIIGNVNAITYKEIFPLLKENKLWLGASIHSGDRKFNVPNDYPLNAAGCGIDEKGRKFIRVKGVRWFTNLDHKQRHEELIPEPRYSPENYPKYDNYDAINVDKTRAIPCNYSGVMGVPITFLDKYNPDQFEIIGISGKLAGNTILLDGSVKKNPGRFYVNGKRLYDRIAIRYTKEWIANHPFDFGEALS